LQQGTVGSAHPTVRGKPQRSRDLWSALARSEGHFDAERSYDALVPRRQARLAIWLGGGRAGRSHVAEPRETSDKFPKHESYKETGA